ncbi:MAG: methyltransferase [Treponema sp.]|jgi:SAM-dependent methyltransferase|nr:methyltransferase [Treponema sp.]
MADPCPGFSSVSRYLAREVPFRFRGRDFTFALSRELFSSADIDRGTRLLLRTFSRRLDEDLRAGKAPPRAVLDCGCGAGVIGICAAAALGAVRAEGGLSVSSAGPRVRSQDRDEMARLFTEYNARRNQIPPDALEARTEPLLAGPSGGRWDLILSNVPAKAGRPVLEDFIRRSAALLNPGGLVMLVVVHSLAGFFRARIEESCARPPEEEAGAGHSVFVYGASGRAVSGGCRPEEREASGGLLASRPFYLRKSGDYRMEGIPLRLDTVYGAAGFDSPGGAAAAAAKLARRLGPEKLGLAAAGALLVHEPGQGFFPLWLLGYLRGAGPGTRGPAGGYSLVLSGRNILALEAARHNIRTAFPVRAGGELARGEGEPGGPGGGLSGPEILCAVDLPAVRDGPFSFIAAFPETVSPKAPRAPGEKDRHGPLWEGIARLLVPGGTALVALASAGAERFDREKPAGFSRLGALRREGFQAVAYNKRVTFSSPPSEADS